MCAQPFISDKMELCTHGTLGGGSRASYDIRRGSKALFNVVQGGSRRLFKPPWGGGGVGGLKMFEEARALTFELEPLLR